MNIVEFIKPECYALVPVMAALGAFLRASVLPNKLIPLVLGCVGIVLVALWTISANELTSVSDWSGALFTSVIQGVLCAAAAVYGHQIVKQAKKGR